MTHKEVSVPPLQGPLEESPTWLPAAEASGDAPTRVALYSHDTMGLGHTRRNLLIAQTLTKNAPQMNALMITGARASSAFSFPSGVDCLTLPAFHKDEHGAYRPRSLPLSLDALTNLRTQTIAAALKAFDPQVLIVDNVPRGAVRELDLVLAALRASGRTRCILGLRDVIDEPVAVRRQWQQLSNEQAIRDWYDEIWVYGDQKVYDVAREYHFTPDVTSKIRYTGYLDQRSRERTAETERAIARLDLPAGRLVVCMAGGGQDGTELVEAFHRTPLPTGTTGVLLAGPYLPESTWAELQQAVRHNTQLRVVRFLPEPAALLERADDIIAMGGYNTVMELLSYGKRALIIPRVKPRLEQLIRAERLADLGLLEVLHPDALHPNALAQWLSTSRLPASAYQQLDMNGLARIPTLLSRVTAPELDCEVI